ncbi:MAG: EamA family transporter [Alphaproteobacteria bacterium]|nr:EamA family transporter [Alphaproteobacteria bacterium]
MHAELVALVLVSAFLHAIWGTVVRASRDRLMATTVGVLVPGLICLVLVRGVTPPAGPAWPWLIASVALHLGYYLVLMVAYRFGDLAQVYPIARGGAPLVVAAIAVAWLDEPMPPSRVIGIAMISFGLFGLAIDRRLFTRKGAIGLGCAVVTATMIGASTAVDFVGLHRANSTMGYIVWINLIEALLLVPGGLLIRAGAIKRLPWRELPRQAAAGLVVAASYAMLLWALSLGDAMPVAALRETSVVFATLVGTVFLGETMGWQRALAAGVVAAGVLVLNL